MTVPLNPAVWSVLLNLCCLIALSALQCLRLCPGHTRLLPLLPILLVSTSASGSSTYRSCAWTVFSPLSQVCTLGDLNLNFPGHFTWKMATLLIVLCTSSLICLYFSPLQGMPNDNPDTFYFSTLWIIFLSLSDLILAHSSLLAFQSLTFWTAPYISLSS